MTVNKEKFEQDALEAKFMRNFTLRLVMKKGVVFILLILGLVGSGFGQINDRIKDRSSGNNRDRNNSSSNTGPSRNSNTGRNVGGDDTGCAGGCIQGCAAAGCAMAVNGIFRGMFRYNRRIMDKKPNVRRVISLDVIPEVGIGLNSDNTFLIMPRVRGNLGLFSTDFRFYNRLESGVDYIDTWKTLEWQILQFNLIQNRYANFRVGSGIYVENFEGIVFNEHTIALSLYVPLIKSAGDLEYRIAPDYSTGDIPRQEVNLHLRRKLVGVPNLDIYGSIGGMYQNFYRGIEAWSGTAGLHININ